jgi:hypothetical protein
MDKALKIQIAAAVAGAIVAFFVAKHLQKIL